MMRFYMAEDHHPSAEYSRWCSTVARRFLFGDTILCDPRQIELPSDVLAHIPPVPSVPRSTHVPDRQHQEVRLRVGTHASCRQQPANVDSDEDDTHDKDRNNSQPQPSLSNLPSSYGLGHAKLSH